MNFLDKATAFLPFGKKEEKLEYFFAVNIGVEKLTAALWVIDGKELKILDAASQIYSSLDEIVAIVDKLLDQVLGLKEVEPQKILFGVPQSWLSDDSLKDEYLKIIRHLVKELELAPMAYVATSHALVHFLEKQEGVPVTAVLVGFENDHLAVTVVRAGKIDGVKVIKRGESSGLDIEKALLTFTEVETLPSKILIYGANATELKNQLLSFAWMSQLSFLHFPKIDVLNDEIEIKSVCLAGGSELNGEVVFKDQLLKKPSDKVRILTEDQTKKEDINDDINIEVQNGQKEVGQKEDFGFIVGDVTQQKQQEDEIIDEPGQDFSEEGEELTQPKLAVEEEKQELVIPDRNIEIDDFEEESTAPPVAPVTHKGKFSFKKLIPKNFTAVTILCGILGVIALIIGVYLYLLKADIKVFVEPKILEKDAQVIADPNQKTVDENARIIPGQVISVDISGSAKDSASGKKQIGDPAKGTVIVYNKTSSPVSLSKGVQFSSSSGVKFTLDTTVNIASQSATDSGITFGKTNTTATAVTIGADGNLPSGTDFTIAGYTTDKLAAKSEGNFAGGTSKDVTVVSSEDQQRLLAKLSSDLRSQAQQKLQEKYPNKKILQEALSESITKKSYNKNINDQASEFSLNMTITYKGTAFDDADLRTIVSKLVNTQVPDGFTLDIAETETQADISELKKDGKLVFLARFKAKMLPKIDTDKIKNQVKLKTPEQAADMLKGMDNVLGSEINLTPSLPSILARLPILSKNITVEVGLK